jgi:proprotein convertase subtilisin/kexin type 5
MDSVSGTCKPCNESIPYCLKCNIEGTECLSCNSTKTYLDATTKKCLNCTAPCLECLSETQCLSCADDTTFLVPITYTCQKCSDDMKYCSTCLKSKVCTSCDTSVGSLFLAFPPSIYCFNFSSMPWLWGCAS